MQQAVSNDREEPNTDDAEIIKSLLNYPSLEKVFDRNDPRNLSAMRGKMRSTMDDLERVVRRGAKADADKAATALRAYQTTLSFLDELENSRRLNSK